MKNMQRPFLRVIIKNHFGLHLKELLIQRNKHISHQSKLAYIYIYIYMTFCERLIYSLNVLSMTMVSYYLHTSPRQIIDIISKRNANKSQGYDHISVAILQVCHSQVAILLQIIYQKCISSGTFPNFWKHANIQHISLLPICGKILEKIILIMYMFFKQ